MASFAQEGNLLACISGGSVAVYQLGLPVRQVYKCEKVTSSSDEKLTGCVEEGNSSAKAKQGESNGSDRILACEFSPGAKYLATCDDWKQLVLWQRTQEHLQWTKLSTRILARRGTALTFPKSQDAVLVADKSGDVYSFSTFNPEEEGKLLLGHVSMLLDVKLCGEDKFIATSDRDEKIRISCYSNAYNIHAYCLGHTDFVTRLGYFERDDLLVSGAGDGTLRIWNYQNGEELACIDCKLELGIAAKPGAIEESPNGHDKKEDQSQVEAVATPKEAVEKQADIKCFSCHQDNKLLAVAFDGLTDVLLYHLHKVDNQARLDLLQHLQTSIPPWDITLDPEARLWVLTPTPNQPVHVYALNNSTESDCEKKWLPLEETEDKGGDIVQTVAAINQHWDFFTDSLSVESLFKVLHKARIDNMKEYIERKKQRVSEQRQQGKQKSGGKSSQQDNQKDTEPPAKIAKNS